LPGTDNLYIGTERGKKDRERERQSRRKNKSINEYRGRRKQQKG